MDNNNSNNNNNISNNNGGSKSPILSSSNNSSGSNTPEKRSSGGIKEIKIFDLDDPFTSKRLSGYFSSESMAEFNKMTEADFEGANSGENANISNVTNDLSNTGKVESSSGNGSSSTSTTSTTPSTLSSTTKLLLQSKKKFVRGPSGLSHVTNYDDNDESSSSEEEYDVSSSSSSSIDINSKQQQQQQQSSPLLISKISIPATTSTIVSPNSTSPSLSGTRKSSSTNSISICKSPLISDIDSNNSNSTVGSPSSTSSTTISSILSSSPPLTISSKLLNNKNIVSLEKESDINNNNNNNNNNISNNNINDNSSSSGSGIIKPKSTKTFLELDEKSFLKVFSFLLAEDLVQLIKTCKFTCNIINNNQQLWKELCSNYIKLYSEPNDIYIWEDDLFPPHSVNSISINSSSSSSSSGNSGFLSIGSSAGSTIISKLRPMERARSNTIALPSPVLFNEITTINNNINHNNILNNTNIISSTSILPPQSPTTPTSSNIPSSSIFNSNNSNNISNNNNSSSGTSSSSSSSIPTSTNGIGTGIVYGSYNSSNIILNSVLRKFTPINTTPSTSEVTDFIESCHHFPSKLLICKLVQRYIVPREYQRALSDGDWQKIVERPIQLRVGKLLKKVIDQKKVVFDYGTMLILRTFIKGHLQQSSDMAKGLLSGLDKKKILKVFDISRVNDVLLHKIFRNFDMRELSICQRVCKKWNKYIENSSLWEQLYYHYRKKLHYEGDINIWEDPSLNSVDYLYSYCTTQQLINNGINNLNQQNISNNNNQIVNSQNNNNNNNVNSLSSSTGINNNNNNISTSNPLNNSNGGSGFSTPISSTATTPSSMTPTCTPSGGSATTSPIAQSPIVAPTLSNNSSNGQSIQPPPFSPILSATTSPRSMSISLSTPPLPLKPPELKLPNEINISSTTTTTITTTTTTNQLSLSSNSIINNVEQLDLSNSLESIDNSNNNNNNNDIENNNNNDNSITNNNEKVSIPNIKSNVQKLMNLNQLVDKLTSITVVTEISEVNACLATYRTFISTSQLIEKLFQRYHIPRASNVKSVLDWKQRIETPIQAKVCKVFKKLIDDHFADFNSTIITIFKIFLRHIIDKSSPLTNHLIRSFSKKLYKIDQMDTLHLDDKRRPNRSQSKIGRMMSVRKATQFNDIIALPAEEIAKQLTLIEFEIFSKIQSSEFLNQAWAKEKTFHLAPNIRAAIDRFNTVTKWVCTVILKEEKIRSRTKIMSKLLKVAKNLRSYGNYHTLMAILSGLNEIHIFRLKHTQQELKPKIQKVSQELQTLMSVEGNHEAYRNELSQVDPKQSCIPYLGVYLKDLTFIQDDTNKVGPGINIKQSLNLYNILKTIQHFQKIPYQFEEFPKIKETLLSLPVWTEENLYRVSLSREPRNCKRSDLH